MFCSGSLHVVFVLDIKRVWILRTAIIARFMKTINRWLSGAGLRRNFPKTRRRFKHVNLRDIIKTNVLLWFEFLRRVCFDVKLTAYAYCLIVYVHWRYAFVCWLCKVAIPCAAFANWLYAYVS